MSRARSSSANYKDVDAWLSSSTKSAPAAKPLVPASVAPDSDFGPGWYASSSDLRKGLLIIEYADDHAWRECQAVDAQLSQSLKAAQTAAAQPNDMAEESADAREPVTVF